MKTRLLLFLAIGMLAVLFVISPTESFGLCTSEIFEDWPDAPCGPLDISQLQLKQMWEEYDDYKGKQWMSIKKKEMIKSILDSSLDSWLTNISNYHVYTFYTVTSDNYLYETKFQYPIPGSGIIKSQYSPLAQLKAGIPPHEIRCNEGNKLLIKLTDGTPACVRKDTAEKLESKVWTDSREYKKILTVCKDPIIVMIHDEIFVACVPPPNADIVFDLPPPIYKRIPCSGMHGCSSVYSYVEQIPSDLLTDERKNTIIQKILSSPETENWPLEGSLDHFIIQSKGPRRQADVQFFVPRVKMPQHNQCEYYDSVSIDIETLEILNEFRDFVKLEKCDK